MLLVRYDWPSEPNTYICMILCMCSLNGTCYSAQDKAYSELYVKLNTKEKRIWSKGIGTEIELERMYSRLRLVMEMY